MTAYYNENNPVAAAVLRELAAANPAGNNRGYRMPNLKIINGEVFLTDDGKRVVDRGGDDAVNGEEMLMLEIVSRAPGMSPDEVQRCAVSITLQYGRDALVAIRGGHVHFERRQ